MTTKCFGVLFSGNRGIPVSRNIRLNNNQILNIGLKYESEDKKRGPQFRL